MRSLALLIAVFAFGAATHAAKLPRGEHLRFYSVKGEFEMVREDVRQAITERGLVIDHVSHMSDMLDRTGKDIGTARRIFGKAESLQFCSAPISRRTMEADPANIVFCPYIIAVYTLPNDAKTVYVGYRRPQPVGSEASKQSLKAVEDLLDSIVREALDLK
jgi:uncharacterized protein (DUF302 family)